MAKGLSRIALIVATIAVVMLISSCSDVTESSQSSNKEKSVTSLVGEIYHGDGYFILDENGLQIVKEGAAYDENKKLWNAPFAAVRFRKTVCMSRTAGYLTANITQRSAI